MSSDEVILVDEFGGDQGTMSRAEAHRSGTRHRAVAVYIFNSLGQLLMQRRAAQKNHSGELWSNTCCTHPKPGEEPADTAVRRLREELGIDAEVAEVFRFAYSARVAPTLIEHEYDHVFLGVSDSTPDPNPEEVLDWSWWDVRYLRDRIAASSDSFTPWFRYSLEHVCDLAREDGLLSHQGAPIALGAARSERPTCFVICPYEAASGDSDNGDEFVKEIVNPVVIALGFDVLRGHMPNKETSIPGYIDRCLVEADLVIANLAGANPNVMYELGKRHAVGGQCVQLTTDAPEALPFDVRHQRTIRFSHNDLDSLQAAHRELGRTIRSAGAAQPAQLSVPPERVAQSMGHTVVASYGRADRTHYEVARRLAEQPCRRIFLMQRSSTLILGPRRDWADEKRCLDSLLAAVEAGASLYHLVDLRGLARHYDPLKYPEYRASRERLAVVDGALVLPIGAGRHVLRRVEEDNSTDSDLPDRAARAFVVELVDGSCEGVLVFDVGGMQFYFHIMGSKMAQFLDDGCELYRRSPVLTSDELDAAMASEGH